MGNIYNLLYTPNAGSRCAPDKSLQGKYIPFWKGNAASYHIQHLTKKEGSLDHVIPDCLCVYLEVDVPHLIDIVYCGKSQAGIALWDKHSSVSDTA